MSIISGAGDSSVMNCTNIDNDASECEKLEGLNSEVQVYRSLDHVWKTLNTRSSAPEIQGLMKLCVETGLLDKSVEVEHSTDAVKPTYLGQKRDPAFPFIVVEGLDGTGKTTLTKFLSSCLKMKLMSTPPKYSVMQNVRKYFDDQPESIRRAYYSLGNYIAAQDVINTSQPVIMDRFWHSTAAYALAHQIKSGGTQPNTEDFVWPQDLLKPDLVIFLQTSEEERVRRHTQRKNFTNTKEEQTLADDGAFRQNLMNCYRQVQGPKFQELNVDGEIAATQTKVLKSVLEHIPSLINSENEKHQQKASQAC